MSIQDRLVAFCLSTVVLGVPALSVRGSEFDSPAGRTPPGREQASREDEITPTSATLYQDLRWRNAGPTRGGRVTAIAGVRSQPCTYYMGATGGGVWKTDTCGAEWTPISDGQIATGSIGSIDVSESNPDIVWVGTGSAAIRSNVIIGRGVYKSADAGKTWQFMGLKEAGQIGSVIVHPANPDIVWVAALGSPFGPNDERGIFKTTDGGRTWTKPLFVNNSTGGRVIAINYSNPNELYAGMYRGFRKGWDIISGGPATEGGIYKSTDGGETWTKLANGLPGGLIGKIDLDVARSSPRIVYAMIEAPGNEGGLYRSDDAGASWKLVNSAGNLRPRPFYFNYVDVNPKNADEIWVNALGMFKSIDGGKSFTTVSTPHGDNHGIWFNPDNPNHAVQCNDGGANVTTDGGRTWSSILNQPTAELYMVSVDDQHPYLLYAPQQDNSTVVVPSVPVANFGFDHPTQAWTQASGCETGGIWPTPDGKVVWGACKGEVERFNVETGQSQGKWIYPQNRYGHHPDDIKFRFPRQTVIMLSPHDPKIIYQASHVLHRSTDDGVTWQVISQDLTAHEKEFQIVPGNPITRDVTGEEVYSSIYSMDESRLERGVIWVGANDGPVHVTRDNGKTWQNVTPKDLPPGGRVQNIDASRIRKGSAYIAVYRFLREHDLKPYIYRTDDYGVTWTKLTDGANGIPVDHPTRVVREDPEREGLLYAGTEFGFFVSFDNGRRWQSLQQNLPATPVTDIRVHRGDLVISTMGRSFWIMDDIAPLRQLAVAIGSYSTTSDASGRMVSVAPVVGADGRVAAGGALSVRLGRSESVQTLDLRKPTLLQPSTRVRYRRAGGAGRGSGPQYPPVALAIDYVLPAGFSGPVSLEISDATGHVVRTIQPGAAGGRGRGGGPSGGDPDDPGPPSPGGFGEAGMRGGGRGRGGAPSLTTKPGHNRYLWDYRWANGGPLVAPGKYTARLASSSKAFEVVVDPAVLRDGITVADLAEQQTFLLRVRDAQAQANQLRGRIQEAMQKAGVQPPPSPGPGEWVGAARHSHPLQGLWARVVTAPGTYEQGMLIDQLSNITRAEGGADQKVGGESRRRLGDLLTEMKAIEAELQKIAGDRVRQEPLLVVEEVFKATVTSVEDGDSVVVKTPTEQVTVHLAGVDAPEMSQSGGPEAKAFLSALVLGKTVTVRLRSVTERLGAVEIDGADVSATLIRRGMAWHCPRYTDDRELTSAEADARAAKRGLWSAPRPTPPWLHRGAGACWQQKKGGGSAVPANLERPDFSGTWTTVSPLDRAGQQLTIRQDAVSLTMEHPSERGAHSLVYKLDGTTGRAFSTPQGPVDTVAKTRWNGRSLIVEERRWTKPGEEATNVRQILWLDDRGFLNLEVGSPRPIGENDTTKLVLQRDGPRQ